VLATLAAASTLLAPIPPAQAFDLPSIRWCVGGATVAFRVRELPAKGKWKTLTVKVDGTRVKRVTRPRPGRTILLRKLPLRTFTLSIRARTDDGRQASVRRRFTACAQGADPTITIPDGPPPTALITRDLITGSGTVAGEGTTVTAHYKLVTWSNRKTVEASWAYGDPFTFTRGSGQVVPGFDQGMAGMRVGGRREIVVPADLAYGEQGVPPMIAENETLVFVIDLIAAEG